MIDGATDAGCRDTHEKRLEIIVTFIRQRKIFSVLDQMDSGPDFVMFRLSSYLIVTSLASTDTARVEEAAEYRDRQIKF